jgi:NADH:ubiquinone oxidoreductase subunit 4 (subunit M)
VAPLVAAIIWLGVYPKPVLDRMQPAAEHFVEQVQSGANAAEAMWRASR